MNQEELKKTAKAVVDKGILAMDESTGTCTKRFEELNIESTEETRRQYRQLLIQTPNLQKYISGAILFDETFRQKTDSGVLFPKYLADKGIIPGIKVDLGVKPLAEFKGEKITEGLDGLRERLKEYKELGAKFAKWRAVIIIGAFATDGSIHANAHALARYAALCQEQGIVPIIEPEVLTEGDHDIENSCEVTIRTLKMVFEECRKMHVYTGGIILKPNMILPGIDCRIQAGPETVVEKTMDCLRDNVRPEIPGIAFLSGGQSDELATKHLNLMNKQEDLPWRLTFSYGRALQREALKAWAGDKNNTSKAQQALLKRAEESFLASKGKL